MLKVSYKPLYFHQISIKQFFWKERYDYFDKKNV